VPDPKSDGNQRSGLGSVGADSPRNGKLNGGGEDGPARASVHELLALVETERNKMSKAVLSSADGLSSAVTMARKRLAANIAAVEEQLREEKRLLEQARGDQTLTASSSSTSELQALLNARDAELETVRREKRAVEDERDELRRDLAAARKELMESNLRATAAAESAAALQAEVNVLRGNLKGDETFPLPLPVPGKANPMLTVLLLPSSSLALSLTCPFPCVWPWFCPNLSRCQ
jgi:chromosome segregation ATPase